MSYNKNTVNWSYLDDIVRIWKDSGKEVKIEILGYVDGRGLNDNKDTKYPIRKAVNCDDGIVVIERMERTYDCDTDDVIKSYTFKVGEVPNDWEIEICYGYEEKEFTLKCPECGVELEILPNGEQCPKCGWIDIDV